MLGDACDDALEQAVAGLVTFAVVDALESDDVDEDEDERAVGPVAAVEFVVQVGQTRRPGTDTGQRVGLAERQRVSQRLAVCERLPAISSTLLAIGRRGIAIPSGLRAMLGGLGAIYSAARRRCSAARVAISGPLTSRAPSRS